MCLYVLLHFFFFKQKTAYEMRISDWSSDVCSSDLVDPKQFASTMSSFAVNAKAGRAKQFAMRSQIGGTPSLVIDGKYLVKGTSYENMLQIADELIAMERAAGQ